MSNNEIQNSENQAGALDRPDRRERWHGKQNNGTWITLGVMSHREAMSEMERLDLGEIATDEGLGTIA